MTPKTLEQHDANSQVGGANENKPCKMPEVMQKMLGSCGPMLAEMMRGSALGDNSDEHLAEGEGAQPPHDLARKMRDSGCAPMMERMMGTCCQMGTKKPDRTD
jgi:hypothetical protein